MCKVINPNPFRTCQVLISLVLMFCKLVGIATDKLKGKSKLPDRSSVQDKNFNRNKLIF